MTEFYRSAAAGAQPRQEPGYVGRFAPSPTGELHIGSLLAATASYLDARACGGRWLLRLEDLDPPREVPGAAQAIIATLQAFGFAWDGPIVWQHERHAAYRDALEQLRASGLAYACTCSRKQIQQAGLRGIDGWRYPGTCRQSAGAPECQHAWRVNVGETRLAFLDRVQQLQSQHLGEELGDFVLLRADGCWAYQLAVVVDDAAAGVTDVVRGADLLDSTLRQIFLQQALGLPVPRYLHVPVLANAAGEKLSKQTLARALDAGREVELLAFVLQALGQEVPPQWRDAGLPELWSWAREHWTVSKIPQCRTIPVEYGEGSGYKIL
ncbi:tRNA glutamyl-Q(34) synthetase GluQRS [Chitinilyticum litopenaei]|uniref:tRNA glutamyl-Q(34) synthetase GluQRS n=1 Tax=Chitinilyticum litopenaei TaxID=1121276 RepID=UPI000426469D|nr:tRNA glutamyl-Q(34) synthetase GluQRS [Chitinilyticum litopenaei]